MRLLKLFVPAIAVGACVVAFAQTPHYSGIGRTPTQEEIKAWDIAIGPDGKELPPGSGTAKDGAALYSEKCSACHGADGQGGVGPQLIGGKSPRVIANWQFATQIWDIINRSMPLNDQGSLSTDQVYAVTAYLLQRNGDIQDTDVIDASSLPKVKMGKH